MAVHTITIPSLRFGNDGTANKWGRSHDAQTVKEADQTVFTNASWPVRHCLMTHWSWRIGKDDLVNFLYGLDISIR